MSHTDATQRTIEGALAKHHFRREALRRAGGVFLPRFADIRYAGRLPSGRRATIGFAGVGAHTRVRLSVAADEAARFLVAKQGWLDWVGSALGLGAPWNLESAAATERAVLERRSVQEALRGVFSAKADSLELARGELTALFPFLETPPEEYVPRLHVLEAIARSFDRTELRVRVLKGVRRALSGEHGPRCAYCHGGLSGEEADLVACEECATVLHQSCWHENTRCPILGCTGVQPERGVGGGR